MTMIHPLHTMIRYGQDAILNRALSRKGSKRPLPRDPETFLFIVLNAIGDAVMAQPVWRLLKSARPQARLELLCRPQIATLFSQDPSLDAIHSYEANADAWWNPKNVRPIEVLWAKQKYEVILDFTEIPVTALACARDTAPPSVGFDRLASKPGPGKNLSCAYDYSVPYTDSEPIREVMARLASPWISPDLSRPHPFVALSKETLEGAATMLQERSLAGERLLVCHPGAKWPPKRWPVSHWGSLIQVLRHGPSWNVLLLGGGDDARLLRAILRECGDPAIPLLTCDSLSTAAGILRLASLCICNDSAAMHLAAAVGTPSIALFGPVPPLKSAPSLQEGCRALYEELFCSPCTLYYSRHRCRRGLNFCMHAIRPETVFREVEKSINNEDRGGT